MDRELLFVASMLHDLGLTKTFRRGSGRDFVPGYEREDASCFAVRGAGVAQSLVTHHGWPQACGDTLGETIALHLNVRVARSRGIEAHLLNAATAFDVIRLGCRKLPPELVQDIESRWPRGDDFCNEIREAWNREAQSNRECRVAFLNIWPLSFERRIERRCC